jgi:aminopeptidase N
MVGVPGYAGEAAESSQMGMFDTAFLAATPETRTDADADAILRLVGHEIFHTYSGGCLIVTWLP